MLRVQLLNNKLNPLVLDKTDPAGLNGFEMTIKRSNDHDGLFKEFSLELDFNNEGREFIRTVYEAEGIDGEIIVNVYEYDVNNDEWELYYSGQLRLENYEIGEITVKGNIEQKGVEKKFLKLLKNDVDLDSTVSQNQITVLPTLPTITLPFHSKGILKELDARGQNDIFDNPDWDSATTYSIGDRVNYQGAAYDSRTDNNLNNTPPINPPVGESGIENTHWSRVFNAFEENFINLSVPANNTAISVEWIGQIETSGGNLKEIDDNFSLPWGFPYSFDNENNLVINNFVEFQENGTFDVDISLHMRYYVRAFSENGDVDVQGCGNSALGNLSIQAFYVHKDFDGNVKFISAINNSPITNAPCGDEEWQSNFVLDTLSLTDYEAEIGDTLTVYTLFQLSGTYDGGGGTTVRHDIGMESIYDDTYINVKQSTTFESTNHKSILIYEFFDKICQYYMDNAVAFRSDFFGRTDTTPAYAQDGEGALIAITNGRILRQSTNETIFGTFEDAFNALSSIYCLGWGFEKIDSGETVVRIEKKEYFYDKNTTVLELGNVSDLKKTSLGRLYKNQVEIGFPKIEKIAQTNAVDEFNAPRKYTSPIVSSTGNEKILGKYRASGFEIESQRRLVQSTEESRLDDSNFIVVVRRDANAVDGFRTDQAEDFDFINGVFEPETSYNAKISPARNFRRWAKVFGADLIRSDDKVWRFALGELNYEMSSKLTSENITIFENGSIDLTDEDEPLYYLEEYSFTSELRRNEFEILKNNPRGVVAFLDWENNKVYGFVQEVSDNRNANKAKFKLRRVYL